MGGWLAGCVRRGVDGWMGGWTVEGMNGEIGGGWMDGRWTKEEHSPPTRHPTTAPPPRRCALLRGMRWPACLWPPGFCSTGHPESLVLPHSSPQGLGCLFCLCPGARSWCPCQERGEWPDHAQCQPSHDQLHAAGVLLTSLGLNFLIYKVGIRALLRLFSARLHPVPSPPPLLQ